MTLIYVLLTISFSFRDLELIKLNKHDMIFLINLPTFIHCDKYCHISICAIGHTNNLYQ